MAVNTAARLARLPLQLRVSSKPNTMGLTTLCSRNPLTQSVNVRVHWMRYRNQIAKTRASCCCAKRYNGRRMPLACCPHHRSEVPAPITMRMFTIRLGTKEGRRTRITKTPSTPLHRESSKSMEMTMDLEIFPPSSFLLPPNLLSSTIVIIRRHDMRKTMAPTSQLL